MLKSVKVAVGAILLMGLMGCGSSSAPDNSASTLPTTKIAHEGHSHEGWWCDEHGLPEDVCAMCNAKIAAQYKAKGDWCEEHDRPESQCFICHPEKEAEFAALYQAKYGTKPPIIR